MARQLEVQEQICEVEFRLYHVCFRTFCCSCPGAGLTTTFFFLKMARMTPMIQINQVSLSQPVPRGVVEEILDTIVIVRPQNVSKDLTLLA